MAPKKRWTPQAAAVAGFSIHNFFKPPPAAPTFFAFTAFLYSQAWSSQGQLIYRPGLNLSRVLIWYSLLFLMSAILKGGTKVYGMHKAYA